MNRVVVTGIVAVSQLVLAGLAVAPQLSARTTGETYLMEVAPLDPIDPFRGAYVTLDYPDLRHDDSGASDNETGDVYVTLVQRGDVWVGDEWTRERPGTGPYLACDDRSWQVRCGIESLFLPQAEAQETEDLLADGAVAEIRIDGRGNAAVVDVRAP